MTPSAEIDAYIAAATPERQAKMRAVRAAVHAASSDVTEGMDWKMPVFRKGERYFALANQKSYVSLYFGCDMARCTAIVAALKGSDRRLKSGKSCLNVPDGVPVPLQGLAEAIREVLR